MTALTEEARQELNQRLRAQHALFCYNAVANTDSEECEAQYHIVR